VKAAILQFLARWKRPACNLAVFAGGMLALGMVQGLIDPRNEVDAQVTEDKRERARAMKEALPPAAYFEHPLKDCTWHANWGPGETPKPRCYMPRSAR
jgi:hypothetical protein